MRDNFSYTSSLNLLFLVRKSVYTQFANPWVLRVGLTKYKVLLAKADAPDICFSETIFGLDLSLSQNRLLEILLFPKICANYIAIIFSQRQTQHSLFDFTT